MGSGGHSVAESVFQGTVVINTGAVPVISTSVLSGSVVRITASLFVELRLTSRRPMSALGLNPFLGPSINNFLTATLLPKASKGSVGVGIF